MTEKHLKKQYWINTLEAGHIYINDGENHMSWQGIVDTLNTLKEENEQLKKENMEYHHLVSCDNCKYHNYDWFDDGDELEVCDKGHTERLVYNKFCKEWREFE